MIKKIHKISMLALLASSCGQFQHKQDDAPSAPIASNVIVTPQAVPVTDKSTEKSADGAAALGNADARGAAASAAPASDRIRGEITLKKSQILDRTFLYGFDLQFSSGADPKLTLINQTMALGHIPVTFSIVGDKLQILTDSRRLFESTVNHPETLVTEFEITNESNDSLTVVIERPGLLLHKTVNGAKAPAPADMWVRSLQYIEQGNYLLLESAIMAADGSVQTFMESLFPRETLVPANYQGIEDNHDTNDSSARFMFINNEPVYVQRGVTNGVPVRSQTTFANRFNLATPTSTIDWYVTPNAPDEFMKELNSGVAGWNRYFRDQLGRDVVQFKGRLPAEVKIGDPRYNVINFDTVAQAGAAYETQASDPLTGIQSHSMIYMPYAWYNIASALSDSRELPGAASAKIGPKSPEVLFGSSREIVRCVRDAADAGLGPLQADLLDATTDQEAAKVVDNFGRRVFISTLFHEMGHAFGLGHNFKASLAYDGTKPVDFAANPTTYSIMDYNYYQDEIDLFKNIGDTDGPKLEYDRQAISYLYNQGKDIKSTDKVIPACKDEDADGVDGGVDPNCIRYDAETNPIIGLEHAAGRLTDETGARGIETKTLAERINIQGGRLIAQLADAKITPDAAAAKKLVKQYTADTSKLIGYYINKGAQSLATNIKLNNGSLRKWRVDPAKDGTTMAEVDRRQRFVTVLNLAANMSGLPEKPALAAKAVSDTIAAPVIQSNRFGSAADRATLAKDLTKNLDDGVTKATGIALAKLRAAVAPTLATGKGQAPFASILINGKTPEQITVQTLHRMTVAGLTATDTGTDDDQAARLASAKSLVTFAALGDDYAGELNAVKAELLTIRANALQAGKQDVVDQTRILVAALQPAPPAPTQP